MQGSGGRADGLKMHKCWNYFICNNAPLSRFSQECSSTQDLLNSLRQMQKMLAVQETSYQQGLRALKKKLSVLHNSTMAFFMAAGPPAHGRRLGRVFGVGHEVHFICKPGYELIGPRTRVCQDSLKWSGQQPMCQRESTQCYFNLEHILLGWRGFASPSSLLTSSTSPAPSSVRPSHCTHFLGSTRCTCDVGFTISGRDNNICTDIDECRLFPLGQPGRLCVHQCVNTPGASTATVPRDTTSPQMDIDECETQTHNCTSDQICVNTYGGFQCVKVECPTMKNATYIKTSQSATIHMYNEGQLPSSPSPRLSNALFPPSAAPYGVHMY
uniref:Sushi domain-containing protein n=1 Tax=Neogobius melanostomus TaxID=47308 RepID=A0A8C6SJB5_9GOBI